MIYKAPHGLVLFLTLQLHLMALSSPISQLPATRAYAAFHQFIHLTNTFPTSYYGVKLQNVQSR